MLGSKLFSDFSLYLLPAYTPVLPWGCQKPLITKLILSLTSHRSCFHFRFGLSIPQFWARSARLFKRVFDVVSSISVVSVGGPFSVPNLKAFEFTVEQQEVNF